VRETEEMLVNATSLYRITVGYAKEINQSEINVKRFGVVVAEKK
jgi:hypothetical protein